MAKDEAAAADDAAEAQPKAGGKKKLLVIILALVAVLVLVGGGLTVYLLTTPPPGEGQAHAEAEEDARPPVYEKLESFTVNLADGETYLQVEIHLMLGDPKLQERLKQRMPEVRDMIIRLLSSKLAEELAVPEGKDALAADVQSQLNGLLKVKKPADGVRKVLFNAFIIQ